MSLYLAVELNEDVKKKLAQKQLILKQNCTSGDFEDPTRFHITVSFLSKEEKDNSLVLEGLKKFKQLYNPQKFEIYAKNFGKFDPDIMWIGVHESLNLYKAKYQIENCLKQVGFEMAPDKFQGYTPHITMGYNVKSKENFDFTFDDNIPIIVDNISLWNGFKANRTYIHSCIYRLDLK